MFLKKSRILTRPVSELSHSAKTPMASCTGISTELGIVHKMFIFFNFFYCNATAFRLYKETPPKGDDRLKKKKDKDKKKKKKDKKEKKKKKKRNKSVSSCEEEESTLATWSVACLTLADWESLTDKYKKSKRKCDRELYETLAESFLPEIVKMFAEKEREEKRRLLMMQPKRASSRIERKRQEQEERDRLLAIKVTIKCVPSLLEV